MQVKLGISSTGCLPHVDFDKNTHIYKCNWECPRPAACLTGILVTNSCTGVSYDFISFFKGKTKLFGYKMSFFLIF